MRSAFLVLFSLYLLFDGSQAVACSCADLGETVRQQVWRSLQEADFVAEVEVTSTAELTRVRLQAEINVLKMWKGERGPTLLTTSIGAGSCGLLLNAGQRLLLYAYVDDETDQLRSSTCTRTGLIGNAHEDLQLLDEFATLDPFASAVPAATVAPFTISDLTGVWTGMSNKALTTSQFLEQGEVIWFEDEPNIKSPEASGLRAKYRVRDGSPMWEIDIYDFEDDRFQGATFQGIFQPTDSRRLRLEGVPSNRGDRPTTLGTEAAKFPLIGTTRFPGMGTT